MSQRINVHRWRCITHARTSYGRMVDEKITDRVKSKPPMNHDKA
jgi:hypothetical protein